MNGKCDAGGEVGTGLECGQCRRNKSEEEIVGVGAGASQRSCGSRDPGETPDAGIMIVEIIVRAPRIENGLGAGRGGNKKLRGENQENQ